MIHGHNDRSSELRKWLYSLRARGMRLGTENASRALELLGKPTEGMDIVHVAGTNGKGSVCAMITSILKASGYTVGLYTSPHLIDLKERITINNEMISESDLVYLIEDTKVRLEEKVDPPLKLTFFEFITAVAVRYFSMKKVDFLIAETGLGGRFDATNAFDPVLSVITRIGIDHTDQLGNTIESVASEKAGIMKKGTAIVSSAIEPAATEIIRETAKGLGSSIIEQGKDFRYSNVRCSIDETVFDYEGTRIVRDVRTNLIGCYQAENAATAIAACDALSFLKGFEIDDRDILKGLDKVNFHGRLEVVSKRPLTIVDCGHNPSAVKEMVDSLDRMDRTPDTIIFASSSDKDYKKVASILFPHAKRIILTRYGNERSADPRLLKPLAEELGKDTSMTDSVPEAINLARRITGGDETIIIAGSIFLVGEAISYLLKIGPADIEMAGF